MSIIQPDRRLLTRRRLLQLSGLSSMGLALSSCGVSPSARLNQVFEPLNQRVEELLLRPQTPVPEYSVSANRTRKAVN
jgi:hypothetical protein